MGVVLAQNLLGDCSQAISQGCRHPRTCTGLKSFSKLLPVVVRRPQFGTGCWSETSVPCYMGLSPETLTPQQLVSPTKSEE